MKKILAVFINRNNAIRIMVTALFAASSQPLIAWSMAGLSGAFLENELSYAAVFSNITILLLALFIAWFADNIKANLLLDSEFESRRQVFDSIYAMPIDEFEKKDSGAYYNQIGRDTQILSKELFEGTLKVIVNGLSIGLIAVLLLYCHWMSFLIILIFLLPLTINNLLMPQKIAACQERSMNTLVGMTVKIKDLLSGFFTARFQEGEKQVSGGEKTRIGLARSLTLHKSIVIYDEVLSGLDPQNAELIEDLLLADGERIVIHIAHNSSPGYQDRYDAVVRLAIQNDPGEQME